MINNKNLYYPPGGLLIWMIIFLELLTFSIALVLLAIYSKENPNEFHLSSRALNRSYGFINTLLLLTSGFFMAASLQYINKDDYRKSTIFLQLTMLGGFAFLLVKALEYNEKVTSGLVLGFDTFFNFYWLLTGFHVIHVLVGLVILFSIYRIIKKKKEKVNIEDVEAGAAFWHMCDLIWLLLFPLLYLIF